MDLVNEAYLRLVDQRAVSWKSRAHFFAISATIMRRSLVNYARDRNRLKRGGDAATFQLDEEMDVQIPARNIEIIAVNDLLDQLQEIDKRQARIVEFKFFGGLTIEEISEVMSLSRSTVKRDWAFARAWLRNRLEQQSGHSKR